MSSLPRGLRIIRGYVQVRLYRNGRAYHRNFGIDSPLARELGSIHLAEKRKEILMRRAGIEPEIPGMLFKDVAPLYMKMWGTEKDGDGTHKHSADSIDERQRVIDRELIPQFGEQLFHTIRTIDVERWRAKLLERGVGGTSVNRYMVPLGDMFSMMAKAVAVERVRPFKLPADNPCTHAEKAALVVRDRVASNYELGKLRWAFNELGDPEGWRIVSTALQTLLSLKDLKALKMGDVVDIKRSKTRVPVSMPITITQPLSFRNWKRRWLSAVAKASITGLIFADLRKTAGNEVVGSFDEKLVSQYHGHASMRTTEKIYTKTRMEKMRPLAEHLTAWVAGIKPINPEDEHNG